MISYIIISRKRFIMHIKKQEAGRIRLPVISLLLLQPMSATRSAMSSHGEPMITRRPAMITQPCSMSGLKTATLPCSET